VAVSDPVPLAVDTIDALERGDVARLRALVPERYWDWVDSYLSDEEGWRTADSLVGSPREVSGARRLGPNTARLVLKGPAGEAFVTATFDEHDQLKGFALKPEEYEGIGHIVINCPDERVAELRAFYAPIMGDDLGRRPRLNFDEGNEYRAPRWPDPAYPQQMHLDFDVRDRDGAHERVLGGGASLLADAGGHRTYADPLGHPFCLYAADRDGLRRVVIDCPDPAELEEFYRALLGTDRAVTLAFQAVSPYVAPRWPDPAFPAQMHFDIAVDNPDPVLARVERFGVVPLPPQGGSCPVDPDPAGHPFCLCIHGE
jgi:hypothetical protein